MSLPGTGLQASHLFFSPSLQVSWARLTILQARELSLRDILILEGTCSHYSPLSGVDSWGRQCLEAGEWRGRPSEAPSALSILPWMWTRMVPVFTSILLNCYSHERMWSLVPGLRSVSFWALFCSKYEACSSPAGPDLGKW